MLVKTARISHFLYAIFCVLHKYFTFTNGYIIQYNYYFFYRFQGKIIKYFRKFFNVNYWFRVIRYQSFMLEKSLLR